MSAKVDIPTTLIRHQTGLDQGWNMTSGCDACVTPARTRQMCLLLDTYSNLLGLQLILPPSPNCFSHHRWAVLLFLLKKKRKKKHNSEAQAERVHHPTQLCSAFTVVIHRRPSQIQQQFTLCHIAPVNIASLPAPSMNRHGVVWSKTAKGRDIMKNNSSKTKDVSGLCHFT